MNRIVRLVLAVAAGYLALTVLAGMANFLLAWCMRGAMLRGHASPALFYAAMLLLSVVCCMAGGAVCARIARQAAQQAVVGLMAFAEAMTLAVTVNSWKTVPHWFGPLLLLVYPVALWGGGWVATRKMRASVAVLR